MDNKAAQTQNNLEELYGAMQTLRGKTELQAFLADLCTPGELEALAERWQIACLLNEERHSYRDISALTGASTTTIGRVARFLNQEPHEGYKIALSRMKKTNKKTNK